MRSAPSWSQTQHGLTGTGEMQLPGARVPGQGLMQTKILILKSVIRRKYKFICTVKLTVNLHRCLAKVAHHAKNLECGRCYPPDRSLFKRYCNTGLAGG